MKIAMAQMRMGPTIEENLAKTLLLMERAAALDAELIFFPEVQLSPFFAAKRGEDASRWLVTADGPEITAIRDKARELGLCVSPNVYLSENGKPYDASLMIDGDGEILGVSKMVHIPQTENFWEQDYYTPSDTGFHVYDLPCGRVGIVICFDRHVPDGVRSCARQGAELVIIPTANLTTENMGLFEMEVRGLAVQNCCFVAMCNRVGQEGELRFSGQSILVAPDSRIDFKAGSMEGLYLMDLNPEEARREHAACCWFAHDLLPR